MKRRRKLHWIAAMSIVAIAAAGWIFARGQETNDVASRTPAKPNSFPASTGGDTLHMPKSADRVSASIKIVSGSPTGSTKAIRLDLRIERGWHVNANPASLPFLIPTTVEVQIGDKSVPHQTQYPQGRDSGITLDGKNIKVFDDKASILVATLPGRPNILSPGRRVDMTLTVQSCSDKGLCLPPSTLHFSLTPSQAALR